MAPKLKLMMPVREGFTLIEAFFVMLVITLFTSLTLGYVERVRQEARDVKRLADLSQMRAALELYFHQYQSYPPGSNVALGRGAARTLSAAGWTEESAREPVFMTDVPPDPLPGARSPCVKNVPQPCAYSYTHATSTGYSIRFHLEHGVHPLAAPGLYRLTPQGWRP